MNNYWHTNYKADQEGPVTLRYVLAFHRGSDTAVAKKLGLEAGSPLVPMAAAPASPLPLFPVAVGSEAFVATRLKPSADGRSWLLRLFNASSTPQTLKLSEEALQAGRVFWSDVDGNRGPRLASPLEVPAFGIVTLFIAK